MNRERQQPKVMPLNRDLPQMINVHTGLYVRRPREEANLIIERGNTTSHDHPGRVYAIQ
jgi:hypothetical protein